MVITTTIQNAAKETVLETQMNVTECLKLYSNAVTELAPLFVETVQAIQAAVESANTPIDAKVQ